MNYGWINKARLLLIDEATSITIKSFEENGDVLIIANDFVEELGIYQEYYLMMYYTNTNVNKKYGGYFSTNGILLYKINASLMYYPTYNKYDVFFNNDAIDINNSQNLIRLIKNDKGGYLFDKDSYVSAEYQNELPYNFYILDTNINEAKIVFNKK